MIFILRKKLLVCLITALCFYIVLRESRNNVTIENKYHNIISNENDTDNLNLRFVVVHLDLKAMAPKIYYLKQLLENIHKLGVNGILMEYEDMFPFEGKLRRISSKYSFSPDELTDFLNHAKKLGVQVIPMLDTLGHLEFVLEKHNHLREMPNLTDSICPSRSGSIEFLRSMLNQVIKFHYKISPINYFHIGCGKDAHVNNCDYCKSRRLSDLELYIDHVHTVSNMINYIKPNINILIWDDVFRNLDKEDEAKIGKIQNVELVYRDFNSNVNVSAETLETYKKSFANTWASSGFRGVDGPTSVVPHLEFRLNNHVSWLTLINSYKDLYRFNGIILFGSSRYSRDHPACDILPASFPSLTLNLILIKKFKIIETDESKQPDWYYSNILKGDYKVILKCNSNDPLEFGYLDMVWCQFEEFTLIGLLLCNDFENIDIKSLLQFVTRDFYEFLDNLFGKGCFKTLQWCMLYYGKTYQNLRLDIELEMYYDRRGFIQDFVSYKSNTRQTKLAHLFVALAAMNESTIYGYL